MTQAIQCITHTPGVCTTISILFGLTVSWLYASASLAEAQSACTICLPAMQHGPGPAERPQIARSHVFGLENGVACQLAVYAEARSIPGADALSQPMTDSKNRQYA